MWVQVAFHAGEIVFDSVLEEFVQDIAWIWIPFVVILLLVNLLVARIGLTPLRTAASQAAAIGPGSVSMRLTEEGLPRDVHALVSAVNRGLDRLETAFDAQRRFIADAAHELRTPVAVLKAHVAILSKFEGHAELVDEIGSLERLVNQLLDVARLDVLQLGAGNVVDLDKCRDRGRLPSRTCGHRPWPVDRGGRARRTGPHSRRQRLPVPGAAQHRGKRSALHAGGHHRLHRGRQSACDQRYRSGAPAYRLTRGMPSFAASGRATAARTKEAPVLGMDIAARTVVAHGGTMSVEDAPDGRRRVHHALRATLRARRLVCRREHRAL